MADHLSLNQTPINTPKIIILYTQVFAAREDREKEQVVTVLYSAEP